MARNEIADGYRGVCKSNTPIPAFREFAEMLAVRQPGIEALKAAENPSSEQERLAAHAAISQVLHAKTLLGSGFCYYFRGSGTIAIGDSNGVIDAVFSRPNALHGPAGSFDDDLLADPVEKHYGQYQSAAVRKLALGALLARFGVDRLLSRADQYAAAQDILMDIGLATPETPHHLGYAVARRLNHGPHSFMAAGASGVLPSAEVFDDFAASPSGSEAILEGARNGWLEWEGDTAGGLHDTEAAEAVLGLLVPQVIRPLGAATFGPDANLH